MKRSRLPARWHSTILSTLTSLSTLAGHATFAAQPTPAMQQQVRSATFEVVMRKPESEALSYEKPLPLELLPFTERNDKYWSAGTAFAIGPNTFVSAGHVMASGVGSRFGTPSLRDAERNVYPVDRVLKFSLHEDFMVFTVANAPAVKPLETTATCATDDPVFAVGNALGDGVVIRDGLLTSMTPEDQDGRWKWRASARRPRTSYRHRDRTLAWRESELCVADRQGYGRSWSGCSL
jgi:serine protease Do